MNNLFLNVLSKNDAKLFKPCRIDGFMEKEELVIVVPGSKYIQSKSKNIQKFILDFYNLVGISEPIYHNYTNEWVKKINKGGGEVICLHWDRGITQISVFFAVRKLKNIIREYKNTRDIKLIGISLGGEIVLEALKD